MLKKIFAFALCVLLCFACGCKDNGTNNDNNQSNENNTVNGLISKYSDTISGVFDDKNIALTVGVLTDIHLNGSWAIESSYNNTYKAITSLKDFSVNKKLDLLCVTGDLVDATNSKVMVQYGKEGYPETYEEAYAQQSVRERENLLKVLMDTKDSYSQFFYCLGNHDSTNGSNAKVFIDALSGKGKENYDFFYGADLDKESLTKGNRHIKVGGYNFLAFEGGESNFAWVKAKLDEILAENPAQTVFLLHHFRPTNMTFASQGQSKELRDLLEDYPQAIVFGGHTHSYLDFDNALMQSEKGFISVDVGAVRYVSGDYIVSTSSGAEAINVSGKETEAQSTGLLVEIDKSGNLRINRYNFVLNEKIGSSWVIPKVKADGSRELLYTKDRKGSDQKPVFLDGKAETETAGVRVKVKFPAAFTNQKIYRYDISITDNVSGKKLKTQYASSLFYKYATPADMPNSYIVYVETGEKLSDDITVTVTAVDSWINKSEPLVINSK